MPTSEEAVQLARLAQELHAEHDTPVTGAKVAETALALLPDAAHASLTLLRRREYVSLGATSATATAADEAQYALEEGPCVDAVEHAEWFRSGDVGHDARWPRWGPRAAAAGLHSVLSVRLLCNERSIGALNLYGQERGQFSDVDDIDLLIVFATHAALALSAADLVTDLETAVTSRHTIGMAQGILMERYGLDPEQAFALLRRLSSTQNVKLRAVATGIVTTRQLPEVAQGHK